MPWVPELFSAPVLARIEERRERRMVAVPYFDGLMTGETGALIASFAGEPELHHPVRGRVKGVPAFTRFVADTHSWLAQRNVTVEDVATLMAPGRGVEEVLLHLDGAEGRIELPLALAADRDRDGRILELRVYFRRPPNGAHAGRPPLLQPDERLPEPDVVGDHQRALAAGDVEAAVATFEREGYVRDVATHRGAEELRALYERSFSDRGGIALEHCAMTDDGRACALEYNVAGWGRREMAPEAGIAVYVRGETGMLAAARIYDDTGPPPGQIQLRGR